MMLKKIYQSGMKQKANVRRKKQGELVMLSSNKSKIHKLMMFHRGATTPVFKNLFSESPTNSPIHLAFLPTIVK